VGRQIDLSKDFSALAGLGHLVRVNTAGDLINRATSDVDNIRRLLGFAVLGIASTVFACALTLPVMLSIGDTAFSHDLLLYAHSLVQLFSDRLRNERLKYGNSLRQRVDQGRYRRHRSDQNLRPRAERAPGLPPEQSAVVKAPSDWRKRAWGAISAGEWIVCSRVY